MEPFHTIKQCRLCDSHELLDIIDFGPTPIADILCDSPHDEILKIPLSLGFCHNCSLVQILETIDPDIVFNNDYPYYSSVSPRLMQYFKDSAFNIIDLRKLDTESKVIEVGSNDGYMLKHFKENGIQVLGVDPSGPAIVAKNNGIPTIQKFFSKSLAKEIRNDHSEGFDVLLANNVLAHDANINGVIEGISIVLKDSGMAVIEVPYLKELISNSEFDTIYHQHIFYFSLTSLQEAFTKYKLYINDVEQTDLHGGSLRLFIEKNENPQQRFVTMLEDEKALGVSGVDYYTSFNHHSVQIKQGINALLNELKAQGKRIAGYGAAAKGVTFLAFTGLNHEDLEYVVDLSIHKQGKHLPGSGIPIMPVEKLIDDFPDYVLILAWNFKDEIIQQQSEYLRKGGKFIVAIPQLEIIG